jgi:hypothetical protein
MEPGLEPAALQLGESARDFVAGATNLRRRATSLSGRLVTSAEGCCPAGSPPTSPCRRLRAEPLSLQAASAEPVGSLQGSLWTRSASASSSLAAAEERGSLRGQSWRRRACARSSAAWPTRSVRRRCR